MAAALRPNVVLSWNDALLQAVRTSGMTPPSVARALAIAHTCAFDAWASYTPKANGTELNGSLRRPPSERSSANKEEAISYAMYDAAVDLFPSRKESLFDPLMHALGFDPSTAAADTASPSGVGRAACAAVLSNRHRDGSNQLGDIPGGQEGVAYSDYTNYEPVNAPMHVSAEFDPEAVSDPSYWQPLTYVNAAGQQVTPRFAAHHWNQVEPFALTSASQFRSTEGPAMWGSRDFVQQAEDVLALSAALDDRDKMISEYWSDGPNTETPPGHWNLFAQFVSIRDRNELDDDVKLFFAMNNALLDAGIAAWDNKIAYDSVRPITAIRFLFRDRIVPAWAGPGKGTQPIQGGSWLPYQKASFPTPPFAEFTSGHSTFSAAAAEVLRLFTGADRFGASVTLPRGTSSIEPGKTPATDITLTWRTFTDAADEAGMSRRYGGIHFELGDLEGRRAGREVAVAVWAKVQALLKPTS
ncbi:MAG: vanadium-dependent haloperoxidase [Actinomycetota bacterium]